MKDGEISSKDPIIWNENEEIENDKTVDEKTLSKFALEYDRIPSYHCETCKIFVVEYDKKKKSPTIKW